MNGRINKHFVQIYFSLKYCESHIHKLWIFIKNDNKPKCYSVQLEIFSHWDFFKDFLERFFSSNLGLVWFDLDVYQVSTFNYVCNWSKSLLWWVVQTFRLGLCFDLGPS